MNHKIENHGRGDRLISKVEASEILGVSVRTLERIVAADSLRIRKIRGCVRLLLSDVLEFAEIH